MVSEINKDLPPYDRGHWHDPGLALSLEEVAEYSVKDQLGIEVENTLLFYHVMKGLQNNSVGLKKWAGQVSVNARKCVGILCSKGWPVPPDSVWEPMTAKERIAAGGRTKDLHIAAAHTPLGDLMQSEVDRVEQSLRWNATIGQQAQALNGWKKNEYWRQSNQFVYTLYLQWLGYRKHWDLLKFQKSPDKLSSWWDLEEEEEKRRIKGIEIRREIREREAEEDIPFE
jgi:hypothetical protein